MERSKYVFPPREESSREEMRERRRDHSGQRGWWSASFAFSSALLWKIPVRRLKTELRLPYLMQGNRFEIRLWKCGAAFIVSVRMFIINNQIFYFHFFGFSALCSLHCVGISRGFQSNLCRNNFEVHSLVYQSVTHAPKYNTV